MERAQREPPASGAEGSPARMLAPLALIVAAFIVIVVITLSVTGQDGGGRDGTPAREAAAPKQNTYTVQPGDTLTSISKKTGINEDVLSQLNPDLKDPFNLPTGEELRLGR